MQELFNETNNIIWSADLAYAIGLITSDGSLYRDGRHIQFLSKDKELMENFCRALSLTNRIGMRGRSGEVAKNYFNVTFSNRRFYLFLNEIGVTPAKSRIIQHVGIPDAFFADFLRGLFDGDGTFYTFWDKRWPKSFCFKTSIASASPIFISWLKQRLTTLYGVKGYLHKGAGVTNLEYVKGDSKKLFNAMYYSKNVLCFSVKYNKMKVAIENDEKVGLSFLQKQQNAAVAQW